MPQLAKGGKYVFGISVVKDGYELRVPPEAFREYELNRSGNIILFSGSKTSGGFGINAPHRLLNSKLSDLIGL
jgi:hypothetical protein